MAKKSREKFMAMYCLLKVLLNGVLLPENTNIELHCIEKDFICQGYQNMIL